MKILIHTITEPLAVSTLLQRTSLLGIVNLGVLQRQVAEDWPSVGLKDASRDVGIPEVGKPQ
jgi:hypothetical protein